MLLDGHVLDISKFIGVHPGGKYMLRHNIGRDISKFFYGGYSMEGNLSGKPVAGHVHSNYARLIVNDLIVGHYQKDIAAQSTICKVKVDKTVELNNTTSIFFFESEDKQIVPNFKQYYPGLLMI